MADDNVKENMEENVVSAPDSRADDGASSGAGRAGGWLLLSGVAVVALVVGFGYSLYLSSSPRPAAERPQQPEGDGQPEKPLPVPEIAPAGSASALPDPAAPAPATPEALFGELNQVTDRLLESFPDDPDALEVVARAEQWLGRSDRAIELWEQCLQRDPRYAYAYLGMGSVAAKRGETERAVSLFRKALLFAPASSQAQVDLASALLDLGEIEEAVALLEEHVKTAPNPVAGFVLLGMAHLQRKEYQKAKEYYEKAIALHPKHANAHYGLAQACAHLGLKAESQEYMKRFQELRASEREIRTLERNQFDDLGTMCEDVAGLYVDAGRVYLAYKRLPEVEGLWRRAATLDPADVDCRQALAWLYRQTGRIPQTIEMFQRLTEIEPENLTFPLEIARLYVLSNRFEAAEKTLQGVCQRAPEDPAGYAALAQLYLDTGRKLTEALSLAQKAVQLAPKVAGHCVRLGAICERNQDWKGAVAAMTQAVDLEPENLQYRQMFELLKEKITQEKTQ
jgi:tetratricopeptide (TPR) repeat protein